MAGRPSKYESNVKPKLLLIEAWCRDGLTDADICKNIDVHVGTFCEYKNKYPELREALKRSKEAADILVENMLYKRAMGYEFTEVTEELTENGMVETKRVKKQMAPDTTAQIFWLKNRRPREWRDKQEVEAINHNMNTDVTAMTPEERRERIAELDRKRRIGTAETT
jgi:hypothetical protein